MAQPSVRLTEIDGALGALPESSNRPLAIAGVASSGPLNQPAVFAGSNGLKALLANYTAGPAVEAAAIAINRGVPVLFVRTGQSVAGSYLDAVSAEDGTVSALDLESFTGSATPSVVSDPEPDGAYSVQVMFPIGGTIGVSGIVYQVSVDGGQTWTLATALGTDDTIALDQIGDVTLDLGSGTIGSSSIISFSTTAPIPASAGELVTSLLGGTSVPTVDSAPEPNDDYECRLRVLSGGTVGVAGITVAWSLDGGRTESAATALGTNDYFVFPGSGGVRVEFGAGTLVSGATIAFPTVAPRWNNTEIGEAITALRNTTIPWELLSVIGPVDPGAFDVIESAFSAMLAAGKDRQWIAHVRNPVGDETPGNYAASILGSFSSRSTITGSVSAGAAKIVSGVSSRLYRRPFGFAYAPLVAGVSEELDVAQAPRFSLAGVSIRDGNGNPDEYDESIYGPSLGERFVVARTWEDFQGTFVNNPRLLCPTGSDFEFIQHRRVMNLARTALRIYFQQRLSQPVYVSRKTGFILESEAQEIELGATTAMRSILGIPVSGQGGKASDASFVLSRTDNLLSTKTLTGDGKVIPLAYPKFIDLGIAFANPALQVVAA